MFMSATMLKFVENASRMDRLAFKLLVFLVIWVDARRFPGMGGPSV
jgi:hypothetical protein